jgi:hypothetical protein
MLAKKGGQQRKGGRSGTRPAQASKTPSSKATTPTPIEGSASSDKSLKGSKIGAVAAIAAALIAAAATLLGAVLLTSDPPGPATEEKLREEAKKFENVDPPAPGPWVFRVVAGSQVPDPQGLKVRSTSTRNAEQIGSVVDRQFVWATCLEVSDFDPFPNIYEFGPVWYQIRWPNNTPTAQFFNSSPSAPYFGYVWSGSVVAQGHNGRLPAC